MKPYCEACGRHLANVFYGDIDFVWVVHHHGFHRDGLCNYQGQLCRFQCHEDYDLDGQKKVFCSVHALTPRGQRRWLRAKWLFETCVGFGWSYPKLHREFKELPGGIWVEKRGRVRRLFYCLWIASRHQEGWLCGFAWAWRYS
jgi:hypothetical protein